jgi:predicted aminopeptidase
MTRPLRALLPILLVAPLSLAGCGDTYIGSVITGELNLLSSARPIEEAVNDPNLDQTERDKLAFVVQARDYAQNVIGLNVGTSFQTFVELGDQPLAWNLSASRKDAFDPYYWNLLFVGRIPYIGFFDHDQAKAARDQLVSQGYDTLLYEVDAFSTIGLMPDPVTSALLRRRLHSLADTVFHELTHNTIFDSAQTTFNESLATWVGRTACLQFLASEFGADSAQVEDARLAYEDEDRFQAFLQEMMTNLRPIYDSDATFEDKMTQRAGAIAAAQLHFANDVLPLMHNQTGYAAYPAFPFNNAFLLIEVRYNTDADVFTAAYDSTGHDWAQTLQIFRQAIATPDPSGYLHGLFPK